MSANAEMARSRPVTRRSRSASPKVYLFSSKYNKAEARKIKLTVNNGREDTDQISAKLEDK